MPQSSTTLTSFLISFFTGAIKFGDKLTREECEALVASLANCQFPFQCAHGRSGEMCVCECDGTCGRMYCSPFVCRPSVIPMLDVTLLDRKYPPQSLAVNLSKLKAEKIRTMSTCWAHLTAYYGQHQSVVVLHEFCGDDSVKSTTFFGTWSWTACWNCTNTRWKCHYAVGLNVNETNKFMLEKSRRQFTGNGWERHFLVSHFLVAQSVVMKTRLVMVVEFGHKWRK